MLQPRVFCACLVVTLAAACQPVSPVVTATPIPPQTSPVPTHTFIPTTTVPTPSVTPDIPVKPVVLEPEATRTTLPAQCSPLALHSLEDLPDIVSAPYAPPPPGREERHHGVDFAFYLSVAPKSILGEGVQSVFPGVVAAAISNSFPYGNVVIIETLSGELPTEQKENLDLKTDQSVYILYAHLQDIPMVQLGEVVQTCQPIGVVGSSGNAAVPHLHLETRVGPVGGRFESMQFYDTRAKPESMANYVLWRTSGVYNHFDPFLILSTP